MAQYSVAFKGHKIGSRVVSLAKSLKSSGVKIPFHGTDLKGDHVTELSSGDLILPKEDLQIFVDRVLAIGGHDANANVRSIRSFLNGTIDEEEAEQPSPNGTTLNGASPPGPPIIMSEPPADQKPAKESLVRVDEYTFRLGEQTFNLKSKEVRRTIVPYIRAACGARSFVQFMQNAKIQRASSWLSGVENGTSRITADELEKIADVTKVPLTSLLIGTGLTAVAMHTRGRKKEATGTTLKIPTFSEPEIADFFRSRVLNRNVEPAEGVAIGQLMELAINPAEVNWREAWMTLTKHGSDFTAFMEKEIERFGKMGDPLKILALRAVVQHYWPELNS